MCLKKLSSPVQCCCSQEFFSIGTLSVTVKVLSVPPLTPVPGGLCIIRWVPQRADGSYPPALRYISIFLPLITSGLPPLWTFEQPTLEEPRDIFQVGQDLCLQILGASSPSRPKKVSPAFKIPERRKQPFSSLDSSSAK